MTKPRFGRRSRFAVIIMAAALAAPSAWAQQAEPAPKPGKPINAGDVLSGELNAMKGSRKSKRAATYQITSEPRRLPPPNGLCATAHFHVIHAASAVTSSRLTSGW